MNKEMPSLDKASVDPAVNPYRWVMLSMLWRLYVFIGILSKPAMGSTGAVCLV
jgi:hypothetical protein